MDRNSPVPPAAEVAAAHRYEDSDDSDSENEEEHVENRWVCFFFCDAPKTSMLSLYWAHINPFIYTYCADNKTYV